MALRIYVTSIVYLIFLNLKNDLYNHRSCLHLRLYGYFRWNRSRDNRIVIPKSTKKCGARSAYYIYWPFYQVTLLLICLKYFRSFFNTQSPVRSAYFILLNTDSTKTKISKKQNRASHGFKIKNYCAQSLSEIDEEVVLLIHFSLLQNNLLLKECFLQQSWSSWWNRGTW